MKTRTMFSIGLSAFVLTGSMISASSLGMIAAAAPAENPKQAAASAVKARKALALRKADQAVKYAEAAVAFAPHNAEYRALLGQTYLLAGRFASAQQALADSLSIDSSNPRVALNYALTQIAQGDWAGARGTLDAHTDIALSDRGLAYALAGDPARAVEMLTPAARAADATPKTRQNLALSLALAGHWPEAKSVAAIDIAPDQVDARIMQWASFAKPHNAYDQVASLLNVRPIADSGLPVQLALVHPAENVGVAAVVPAAPAPVEAAAAVETPTVAEAAPVAPVAVAETQTVVESQPVAVAASMPIAGTTPQVVFGPREEVIQSIPVKATAPVAAPVRTVAKAPVRAASAQVPVSAPAAFAKGKFYVQLGAYVSPAVAHDSWKRTARRVPAVAKFSPQSAQVTTKAGNFYRLSVGGFARDDANALCRQVKATGGLCFVRVQAGDQVASWAVRSNTQLASR